MRTQSPLLFHRFAAMACAALAILAGAASAQDYPSRRINMIASFPPGGGTDFLARLVAQRLSERWNVPVTVENKVGGNGIVGARAAVAAAPDGYTLYTGSSNTMIMLATLYDNLPFDVLKDFVPASPIASQHSVLVTHPGVPAKSLMEFVALAKARPGTFNFASPGIGSYDHLAMLMFQSRTGIDATHVPYKGTADAVTALLSGGEVSAMFGSIGTISSHVKAGRLKALAITSPTRVAALPEVPTTTEAGMQDFVIFSWNGVFAPPGTPKPIVDKISREVVAMMKAPEILDRLQSLGYVPAASTPEEFAAQMRAELDRWARVLKDLKINRQKL